MLSLSLLWHNCLNLVEEEIALLVHLLQHAVLEALKHGFVALDLLRHLLFKQWLYHLYKSLLLGITLLFWILREVLSLG